MKGKAKIIMYILAIGVFLLQLKYLIPSRQEANCNAAKDFSKLAFYGTVLKKYRDKEDHSLPKITVLDLSQNKQIEFDLSFETTGIFSILNEGDTIEKKLNSFDVIRYRNTERIFTTDFRCPEIENNKKKRD